MMMNKMSCQMINDVMKFSALFFLTVITGDVMSQQNEPKFNPVDSQSKEVNEAHLLAANSMEYFISQLNNTDNEITMAKLQFRDPDLSAETGQDQFLYLWLSNIYFHQQENLLSGSFFEVPESLNKWHQVGDRLAFEADDVFDWMINNDGQVQGGFTVRLTRKGLGSDEERAAYDDYIGIKEYLPVPDEVNR